MDEIVKSPHFIFLSFPRRRESSNFKQVWAPAFAGVTEKGAFAGVTEKGKFGLRSKTADESHRLGINIHRWFFLYILESCGEAASNKCAERICPWRTN
ncbi:MAG: hypothetical protein K9K88_12980 [Desulfobacterales bacterium]|nr:hypothetical protein [Desulfobacterales bacterium]